MRPHNLIFPTMTTLISSSITHSSLSSWPGMQQSAGVTATSGPLHYMTIRPARLVLQKSLCAFPYCLLTFAQMSPSHCEAFPDPILNCTPSLHILLPYLVSLNSSYHYLSIHTYTYTHVYTHAYVHINITVCLWPQEGKLLKGRDSCLLCSLSILFTRTVLDIE